MGKGKAMKKLVVCVCVLGLLLCGAAKSEDGNLGVYLGVKLGMGVSKQSNTAFGMDANSFTYAGDTYSWDHHRDGMGNTNDAVFGGGATIGYDFGRRFNFPVRTELDYTILANAKDKTSKPNTYNYLTNGVPTPEDLNIEMQTSIRLHTMMLNVWVDIPTGTKFTPYFGGGGGAAFIRHKSAAIEEPGTPHAEVISGSKSFTNFAWNAGAGVAYAINDRWTMDLGYRYVDAGSHKMHYPGEGEVMYTSLGKLKSHNIMLGVRRTF